MVLNWNPISREFFEFSKLSRFLEQFTRVPRSLINFFNSKLFSKCIFSVRNCNTLLFNFWIKFGIRLSKALAQMQSLSKLKILFIYLFSKIYRSSVKVSHQLTEIFTFLTSDQTLQSNCDYRNVSFFSKIVPKNHITKVKFLIFLYENFGKYIFFLMLKSLN